MAQQREKEDTTDLNLKVPETLSTLPSLSTCTQSIQLSPPALPLPLSDESRPSIRLTDPSDPNTSPPNESSSTSSGSNPISSPKKSTKRPRDKEVKRCSCNGCKKKLGLMGFRCRCGDMFCPEHRYSDRHDCSFDYKAAGKEAIAKENPVVRAAKLLKV